MVATMRIGDLDVDVGELSPAQARAIIAARDLAIAAVEGAVAAAPTTSVLLVRVGGTTLAIALRDIAAVIGAPRVDAVPGAPVHHLGLFSHRGNITNLIAVEAVLSLDTGSRGVALVLRGVRPRIALAVDEALGVGQANAAEGAEDAVVRRARLNDGREVAWVAIAPLIEALGVARRSPGTKKE